MYIQKLSASLFSMTTLLTGTTLTVLVSSASLTLVFGHSAQGQGLPYGPDTCRQGYVWREAVPNDHVCVTPKTRSQTAKDNNQVVNRIQPGGGAYGSFTCRQGYVWREAVPNDYVCVTPQTRSQAAKDNSQANSRRALSGVTIDYGTQLNPVHE
ncbi:MAG: hypothetical protein RMX96_25870 [Nostoc sp. ChiSLP02]|nr:hypothetical protein [Nostoc sp. DedSLP05]MDZ8101634.1 hypothetical protein [Nostoc sp. DedSLP01]MDZ8188269.1 hypothetical protein [Nostoc sp. ChiSLP02]